jgi:hypothetical protein
MLGAIPNPKKSSIVNFPIDRLKQSLDNIHLVSKKYKLEKSNPAFHQYTFSASEFLNLGAYVDVDLNQIDDNKTEIIIEVKRKVGAFDQAHEVSLANNHIDNMFDFIGRLTTGSIDEIRSQREAADAKAVVDGKWYNNSVWMFLAALFFFPIAVFGLTKSSRSNTFKIIVGGLSAFMAYSWITKYI